MGNRYEIFQPDVIKYQIINNLIDHSQPATKTVEYNPDFDRIKSEGGESFIDYIEWLGLDKDSGIIVLSSLYHYYYDAEEMKNVKIIVNVKELNQIRNLKEFLHSIFHILPHKSYFIGNFINNIKNNGFEIRKSRSEYKDKMNSEAVENGILSRIPFMNMLYSLLDSKTNNYLSKNSVFHIIKSHGFRLLDMTDLNNMTFFCAQRITSSYT